MASIYSDDQRQSLMDSMTNPESNAAKFLEQGGETGLSPDVTMDILNKYATYGANTGIGNIGGSRLVNALNEEYRKQVDAPLQQNVTQAQNGIATSQALSFEELLNIGELPTDTITAQAPIEFENTVESAPSGIPEAPTEKVTLDTDSSLNSPVTLETDALEVSAPDLDNVEVQTKKEALERYLKENPIVAEQLMKSGASLGSILGKAAVGEDKGGRTPRAPRGGQKASRVAFTPIGMEAGGETAGAEGAAGPNAGLMAILQMLGNILGQSLVGRDKTKRISPAVKPKSHTLTSIDGDELAIGMNEGGKTPEGSVLGRKMFIEGGEVDGPGGPREDMVPIWASDKEYVMSHNGVKRMGGGDFEQGIAALDKVNKNGVA